MKAEAAAGMVIPYFRETNPGFVALAKHTIEEIPGRECRPSQLLDSLVGCLARHVEARRDRQLPP